MAYSNILKPETYSNIDNVTVNKNLKVYSFIFYIYNNDLKDKLLFQKEYIFSCKNKLCKEVNKIYKTKEEIKESLSEIYYNNPDDEKTLPGIYDVTYEIYSELTDKGEEIKKDRLSFTMKNFPVIAYNSEYFLSKDQSKIDGVDTEHYFDNIIYPSINKNIIQVLYSTLEIIEPSFKEYPKI